MPAPKPRPLTSTLKDLSLKPSSSSNRSSARQPKDGPSDSWEDDAENLSDTNKSPTPPPNTPRLQTTHITRTNSPPATPTSAFFPNAPPPTPSTPGFKTASSAVDPRTLNFTPVHAPPATGPREKADPDTRPEKSDAAAARMIAGALGVRAPKRTEEQKAYDRAAREREARKRQREREEKERERLERERARDAMWDG